MYDDFLESFFSFFLLFLSGAQNLIFLGRGFNFVAISFTTSFRKNHFLEPSREGPLEGFSACFPLFFFFFFSTALCWSALTGTALRPDPPPPDPLRPPKISLFFSLSHHNFLSFFFLGVLFLVFLKAGTLKCVRLGSGAVV